MIACQKVLITAYKDNADTYDYQQIIPHQLH